MQLRIENLVANERSSKQILDAQTQSVRFQVWARMFFERIAHHLFKRQTGRGWERIQQKLASAGNPMGMRIGEWFGLRLLIIIFCITLGGILLFAPGGLKGMLFFLACGLLGWIGPEFWLSKQVTERQRLIEKQLPNALDLLTVSVEAGLGFDQALSRVAEKMHGPLSEELNWVMREVQLGTTRSVALQRLASRTGVDSLKSFVSAIIQADKLGIGLAQVLRIQSTWLRERHRLEAQERAMKAPIKMLFPLILFVFPAVFIVILGPAVLHIIQLFAKGGF